MSSLISFSPTSEKFKKVASSIQVLTSGILVDDILALKLQFEIYVLGKNSKHNYSNFCDLETAEFNLNSFFDLNWILIDDWKNEILNLKIRFLVKPKSLAIISTLVRKFAFDFNNFAFNFQFNFSSSLQNCFLEKLFTSKKMKLKILLFNIFEAAALQFSHCGSQQIMWQNRKNEFLNFANADSRVGSEPVVIQSPAFPEYFPVQSQ